MAEGSGIEATGLVKRFGNRTVLDGLDLRVDADANLALTAAFLVAPDLLLLDEPFAGEIDPPGIEAVQTILRGLASAGAMIVVASQLSELVAPLADRVGLLSGKCIIEEGAPAELIERLGVTSLAAAVAAAGGRPVVHAERVVADLVAGRRS